MKSRSVLSTFLFISLFVFLAHPVSAGAIDTSIEVVSRGIDTYFDHKETESFERSFGVSFGNTSEVENLSPAQKIVYMIAAAEHNPFEVEWVRNTFSHDFVWYYIAIVLVSLLTAILSILHKLAPETVGGFSTRFVGHESPFDYTVWGESIALLAILPVIAIPTTEGLLELEHAISSGMVQNSLEFLNMHSGTTGGIFFFEGFTYTSCGSLFAARIQYINQFVANEMKIIFMFSIAWLSTRDFAKVLGEWFISALFMRPVVLWYSCKAVDHISNFNTEYGISPDMTPNEAYSQVWSTTADVAGAVAIDMTLVLIASFITAAVMVLWPVFKFLIKVVMGYLVGSIYKVIRVNNAINAVRRHNE